MQEESNGERQGQGSREHVAIGNRRARRMQLRADGWMGSPARGPVAHVTPRSCIRPRAPSSHDLVSRACPFWGGGAGGSTKQPAAARQSPPTTRRSGVVRAASVASRHAPRACRHSVLLLLSFPLDAEDESNHGGRRPGSCSSTATAACWWSRGDERRARRAEVTWPLPRNAPPP